MPVVIISIFLMLISAWASLSTDLLLSAKTQRLSVLSSGQALIFSELKRYHYETGTWPASLTALSATSGFEHLKQFVPSANGGALSSPTSPWSLQLTNVLSNGTFQYQRIGAIALTTGNITMANYLLSANNTCNTTSSSLDFYSAPNWCGSSTYSYWSKTDTLELKAIRDQWAYKQQQRTANKFSRVYKAIGSFPVMATATALNTLVTKIDASAQAGTSPATCIGNFYWQGIGFECEDLYNQYGNPVKYVRPALKQIQLTSATQVLTAAGAVSTLTTLVTMP